MNVEKSEIMEKSLGGFVDKLMIDKGEKVEKERSDKIMVEVEEELKK